ncbi:MAG: serine hydrolase [Pseudomonadota bacterium]
MRGCSPCLALVVTVLMASCVPPAPAPVPFGDTSIEYVAVEVLVNEDDLSFWDIPLLDEPVMSTAPPDRGDGLDVGELGVDGGDRVAIVALAEELAGGRYGACDSLLLVHQGKLVFEAYFRRGRINITHPQVSATKSYTALALGRAIQLGHLAMSDLDQPLVSLLGDLDPSGFAEGAETITLHDALTMSSGLRISEAQLEAIEQDPRVVAGREQVRAYLRSSAPVTREARRFAYQGTDPTLVMQVIDAVVPGSAEAFIKGELLDRLGITTYGWQTDVSGLPRAGDRASISSRAMAKWGLLVLNEGTWADDQLIPRAYIEKLTARAVALRGEDVDVASASVGNPGYGYFWWQADLLSAGERYFSTSAQGGGGQYVVVVEELDLIVVVTAHGLESPALALIAERIVPAFR